MPRLGVHSRRGRKAWPTLQTVFVAVMVVGAVGGPVACGADYRWFTDETAYLAELTGAVFRNDFGGTPSPGSIPNPLSARGVANLSYDVTADGGLYRVFNGPYAITPYNLSTPLVFQSIANAAAFGGRFSLTDFDERRSAGTFSLTMNLGSGTTLVSTTMSAVAGNDAATFLGLVAYGMSASVSRVSVSTNASDLFVTGERVSIGFPVPTVTIDVRGGAMRQGQAGHPLLTGRTPVVKIGAGTLVLDRANTLSGSLTVREGIVRFAVADAYSGEGITVETGACLQVAPNVVASLPTVDVAAGAMIDVTSGGLFVQSGLTPERAVQLLSEGRGDGTWNGTSGVTSTTAASEAAAGSLRAVGWLDDGAGGILLGYAAAGDTNMDLQIDILDVAGIFGAAKLDTGVSASWSEGDFGYDGIVDILDIAEFVSTGLYDAGTYSPPVASAARVAAVPEPTASAGTVLLLVGTALLLRRSPREFWAASQR